MPYADLEAVRGRLPWRTINTTSRPSQARVQSWLDEAQALLNGALAAGGLPAPYADGSSAATQLGVWVVDYVEARVKNAYGADGERDFVTGEGDEAIAAFNDRLDDILKRPAVYGAMLGTVSAAPDSARRLRSHVLDNSDGESIAAGDFAPAFTKSEVF